MNAATMSPACRRLALAALTVALAACAMDAPRRGEVDLTGEEPFVSRLGDSCRSAADLEIHGVAREPGGDTHHLRITAVGAERRTAFTFSRPLPGATLLTVLGGRRCADCDAGQADWVLAVERINEYAPFEAWVADALMRGERLNCGLPENPVEGTVEHLPRPARKPGDPARAPRFPRQPDAGTTGRDDAGKD